MAKITIEEIQRVLAQDGWKIESTQYVNLDSELTFICNEGHSVYSNWKKIRNKRECPRCKDNKFKNQSSVVKPSEDGTIRLLALDQASHTTGWAVFDNNKLIRFGAFTTSKSDEIARDSAIKDWLLSMIETYRPQRVALEGIQLQEDDGTGRKSPLVFQLLARLQGILMECLYSNNIDYMVCPTNTWRHHCGVKGKFRSDRKRSMQMLVKQWYDVSVSDDEADAIGIGKYASECKWEESKKKNIDVTKEKKKNLIVWE